MSSTPKTSFPQDIGSSFAEDFLLHPDHRVIAGFLLGWVCWSGLVYAGRSHFFQQLVRLCWTCLRNVNSTKLQGPDLEAQSPVNEKNVRQPLSHLVRVRRVSNEAALAFTLDICFVFAGFAGFASLLAYSPSGDTACAFTTAWGSMAAQAARLIGLVILLLELHVRRGSNLEFYCLCAALVIGLSFVLAFTATNTGVIVIVRTLGVALCSRTIFAPTALLSSVGFIVVELYIGTRFLGWDGLRLGFVAFFRQSANLHVARAASLLLLDALTIAPNAVVTNELAQFITFSIGALIVLGTFNQCIAYDEATTNEDHLVRVTLSTSSRTPTPLSIPHPNLPLSVEVRGETLMDSTEARLDLEDVPESPFVPINPRNHVPAPVPVPMSAPPQIGSASVFDSQQRRKILPFQVQYMEQLERHIHTGPIVMPIRTKPQRPHVEVIIEPPRRSPKSSLIDSDILRLQSSSSRTERIPWSPENVTPSDYTNPNSHNSQFTSVTRTSTTFRDSAQSMPLTPALSLSLSTGSRAILPASSRQPGRRRDKSTVETSYKAPGRSVPRQSYSSATTFGGGGGKEELSTVIEGQAGGLGSHRASCSSTITKRMVISRPQSLRSNRASSTQPYPLSKHLSTAPTAVRSSSSHHLTIHRHIQSSDSLTASPIRPSSQYIVTELALPTSPPSNSYERALGSGRLRGPRSPPVTISTPNSRSEWPKVGIPIAGPVRMNSRQSRRRSSSCPELPPLDMGMANLRAIGRQD